MRCLVIEDEPETARYICTGLTRAGYVVDLAANAEDGLRRAAEDGWNVLIVDRMLPGDRDGLAIVRSLRAAGRRTPVLILSALAGLDERVRGLREGGDDYLAKPFAFSELHARIDALVRRAGPEDRSDMLQIADLKLDLRARKAERGGIAIALQPREFRLLEYLVRHQGQVVTRAMLLEAVWDCRFDAQASVVDVQISRLRSKIERSFGPPLLRTLRGIGYMMAADG